MNQDQDLATAYDALKKKLSPEAQDDFKLGQKTWLTFVRKQCNEKQIKAEEDAQKICGNDAGCVEAAYDNQVDCIGGEYNTRIASLEDALKNSKDGSLIVDNSLSGVFSPLEEDSDETGNAGINISYPQIYIPYGEGIKKWNAVQRTMPHNDGGSGGDCQYNSKYTISLATLHFLSFQFANDWYCKGMAHGNGDSKSLAIKLPSGEPLKGEDIFKPESNWEDILSKMVSEKLKPDIGWNCPGPKCSTSPENLKKLVAKSWRISPKGLTIGFDAYAIAAYAQTPSDVKISWEQLKPYLRKDFLNELPQRTK